MASRDEILARFAHDQQTRTAYAQALQAGDRGLADELLESALDGLATHSRWIRDLLSDGWPAQHDIGQDAAEALGLLVNHGDESVHRLALPLIAEAVAAGTAPAWILAFITDQVLVADVSRSDTAPFCATKTASSWFLRLRTRNGWTSAAPRLGWGRLRSTLRTPGRCSSSRHSDVGESE